MIKQSFVPLVAYYPPGLICAKDVTRQFCPNAGDSGSPLMVKNSDDRYYIEGTLSFLKGCDQFAIGARDTSRTKFNLLSNTESPLAYTKLSCHLKWVAEQFGLSYEDQSTNDEACLKGSGQKPPFNSTHQYNSTCRQTTGSDLAGREHKCIFPFYYKDTRYDECGLFESSNFIIPVWRCPTRNITTKYKDTGINHFKDDIETSQGICYDLNLAIQTCDNSLEDGGPGCQRQLDPSITDCFSFLRLPAFSTCKPDCPGGNYRS